MFILHLLNDVISVSQVLADTNDVNVTKVPLTKDFQLQVEKVISLSLFVE